MAIITCPVCGAKNRVDERAEHLQPVCGKCGAKLALSTSPIEVTDQSFLQDVLQVQGIPVLVDCWAPWCGPCRMMTPILHQLAGESEGRYMIAKLNVDENPQVASQLNVSSIPALFIFKDGQVVDRMVGVQQANALRQRLLRQAGISVV